MAYARISRASLYSGVPIDEQNTLYFGKSQEVHKAWFDSKYKELETSGDISYQRDSMYLRLNVVTPLDYQKINRCNWVIYQNPWHDNRLYFGKISSTEYINDGCVHVHFTIDYWLSYIDTIDILGGMIERQNYTNEMDFTNTALRIEHVDVGEPMIYKRYFVNFTNLKYLVSCPLNPVTGQVWEGDTFSPGIRNKIPNTQIFWYDNLPELNSFLSTVKFPESISQISIFYHPEAGFMQIPYPPPMPSKVVNPWSKCFKFPNMYIRVTNNLGDEKIYYPEYWINSVYDLGLANVEFMIDWSYDGGFPCVHLVPANYKGVDLNRSEQMLYDKYPRLAWTGDSYGQWLAVNGQKSIINTAGVLIGSIAAAPITSGLSLLGGLSAIQSINSQYKQQDKVLGSNSNGGAHNFLWTTNPHFCIDIMGPHPGLLQANNEYWNMYGYLCGHTGKPNIDGNPFWNYVKGDINCGIPCNENGKQQIVSMFKNGVRLWHEAGTFGDYTQDNRA